jgi:hypothetical protein
MNSIGVFSGDRVKDTRQEKIVCISLPHKFIPSYSRFRVVYTMFYAYKSKVYFKNPYLPFYLQRIHL